MQSVLSSFALAGAPVSSEPYGSGHINGTQLVVCEGGAVINGFFYRLVSLEAKQTEEILFDGISDIASDAVYIYILSDINNPQLVLADSVKL